MSNKVFSKPLTLFQQKVNDILTDKPEKKVVEDLIKLNMFKESEKDEKMLPLIELYNLLGIEKFMDVMELLAGKTVRFPKKESFKETIQIAICYYYRNFLKYSWDDIKKLSEDENLSSIKMGINVQQLQKFLNKYGEIADARRNK